MISLNDFVKGIAEQFEDTDPTTITANTNFKSLEEWSSLTAMTIVAYVKFEFNKSLIAKDINDSETIEDLYNVIIKK